MAHSLSIRDHLNQARTRLQKASDPAEPDSAALDAQMLLCALLGVERAYLFAYPERILTETEAAAFTVLTDRRAKGEPVAYILGRAAFYDREFQVSPAVLIPRPETELLVEAALQFAATRKTLIAVDIGTGSGAIALSFAANAPHAQVYAVDISPAALNLAARNAAEQGLGRVQFLEGDLGEPLLERGLRCDLLMANLPYIASDVVPGLAVSQYEPQLALDGGADGLRLIETLLRQVPALCQPNALILLEIGSDQGMTSMALAEGILGSGPSYTLMQDYAGLDRFVRIDL